MKNIKYETKLELSFATENGKRNLAETISRMETALKHLKEIQNECSSANVEDDTFYIADRLRRASNEIHGYVCTSLALELASAAGAIDKLARIDMRLSRIEDED